MRWMHDAGRSVMGAVAVAGAMSLAGQAEATVSTTLFADTYVVQDGAKTFAVLDVYIRGSHLGDVMTCLIFGNSSSPAHQVVFATNRASGSDLVRDQDGKIVSGAITGDIFVQAGDSSWLPTYTGPGSMWDSFVTIGARRQGADITNRAGVRPWFPNYTNFSAAIFGLSQFTSVNLPNSNYINNGSGSGWQGPGANPYTSAGTSESPFSRVSLYSNDWASVYNYQDLDRSGSINKVKGRMQAGRLSVKGASVFVAEAGESIDAPGKYHYMIGRFAIDLSTVGTGEIITMNAQFTMTGRHGTGNESGTIFNGSSGTTYKVSNFFSFATSAIGCPSDLDLNGLVDPADISLLLLDFGPCFGCPSDLDGSGATDTADLSLLLLDFGACP